MLDHHTMQGRRLAPGAGATTLLSLSLMTTGCTAGYIVDQNGNIADVGSNTYVSFIQVDASGNETFVDGQAIHVTCHTGMTAPSVFSCDPSAPDGPDVDGTGVGNIALEVPEGDYFVVITPSNDVAQDYASPIFHHSFYTTCTDYFNQKAEPCALYQMKLYSASSWSQALGANQQPQASTDGQFRVIPLIEVTEPTPQGRISF